MTKKRFWLGFLILALVFGMMAAGCDDSTSDSGIEKEGDGNTIGETIITLGYNEYGTDDSYWQCNYNPASLLKGTRILSGDQYVFAYSFKSNVNIDKLQIVLVDTTEAASHWGELSNYIVIGEKISANTVISGTKTIIVTKSATSSAVAANTLVFQASKATSSSPKLTFSAFSFGKPGSVNPTNYTVTFNANGGTGTAPSTVTVSSGESITVPDGSGLSRTGYVFNGWNSSSDGTGMKFPAKTYFTPWENITLYAVWVEASSITYTVTYNINGGTGTTPASQTVNDNSSVTLASGSSFSRNGYSFGGWNTNSSGTGIHYGVNSSYTVTFNVTFYAVWDAISEGGSNVYVGVVTFNDSVNIFPISNNFQTAKNFIKTATNSVDATALCYAVSKAVKMFDENGLPVFDNTFIVTFTDGQDNRSSALYSADQRFITQTQVYNAANTDLSGKPTITSYAIGFTGNEAINAVDMQKLVQNGQYKTANTIYELNGIFQNIADSVLASSKNVVLRTNDGHFTEEEPKLFKLTIKATPELNGVSASSETIYGKLVYDKTQSDAVPIFTVTTNGTYTSFDHPIIGTVDSGKIFLPFNNLKYTKDGTEYFISSVDVEVSTNGGSTYRVDTEDGSTETDISKSIGIVLVIDCSESLGTAFSSVQSAAENFINTLEARK